MIRAFAALLMTLWLTGAAHAQQPVWVQIEAQPTLSQAQDRVRAYAGQLEDVSGYSIGGGWYGIVLGPYSRADANTLLRQYKREGRIPADSFIALGRNFRQQFWPVGVGAQTTAQPLPGTPQPPALTPDAPTDEPTELVVAPVEPDPITPADETPQEARASEALLDRAAREDLQVALQWAGYYNAAIDGAFGRGTRSAMGEWQAANNHEVTGILTSAQRVELLGAYNAVLDGMDLQLVRDDASGIQMLVPTGVVAFSEYEPPFVRFDAKGDLDATVLFISQQGDQNRLFGLYEILQTLAIMPTEGERSRRDSSFQIEGIGEGIHSYVTARLDNGQIKGFALIWPEGDDERRRRILQEMLDSFEAIDGVLDPALATPGEDQAIDLVAGLEVRKPKLSRSGFYIDAQGTVLTTAEAIGSCDRVTINSEHEATVAYTDTEAGIAVLRPDEPLAPLAVAAFQLGVPRLQSEVAVAGYPYGGILVTPSLTFGRLADIRGLNGEEEVKRLDLTAQPGDAGGPVFDNGGSVLGMLLPRENQNGQVLPPEVSFSVDAEVILASLDAAGIAVQTTDTVAFMPPETLTLRAADQTVLVSCW
ncbi:Sporulation related domain-containing protein [Cognatiyoonia koreensis]|uniref:Sporulation related domain-containing protein n=1 Tax=Cognatiyoonia koreensis TaxID=364200 RepID=A0A1I0NET2_9RHOB|nr:trypsin-like peptidase domain-containing protein [Cognatiyoonia koreensis]SEV99740.1 Sporulation related domain-containing protein [Cognatiyoonia koreensis]